MIKGIPNGFGASDLFQLLRDGHPRTRTELAAMTGLARSTVSLRVDELLELGLVIAVGEAASTGGRPPARIALDPNARLVAAADVGATHAVVAISDLAGKILAEQRRDLNIAEGPEPVLQWVIAAIHELLDECSRKPKDILAIGIGLPGPVEHETGRPTNPPIMPGWDGFDVPKRVRASFDVPVLVDNDVNIMALGEQAVGWPGAEDMMFVKAASGIGSGIIGGGLLQRGARGIAGDIGHVPVARGAGIRCTCGNQGCLEAIAGGPAIIAQLRAQGAELDTINDLVALVKAGDIAAIEAVRQAGRDIGEVLTTCVSVINPSIIAIGGVLSLAGEHVIAGVREVVYTRSTPLATEHLSIVSSKAGERAGVIGASIMAVERALSPEGIDAMARDVARDTARASELASGA